MSNAEPPQDAPPPPPSGTTSAPAKPTNPSEPSNSARALASELGRSSGKRQWLMWFAIFCVLAIALGGWRLPWVIFADHSGVSLVIILLFGGTLWKSWRDICFLDRETRRASQQVMQLQQVGDIGRFLAEAKDGLFKSHISSLHTIFKSDAHISQDNLVEVLHARLTARNRVVEMFASVLITLGLIGTIVGLIQSIGGLSSVLDDDSVSMDDMVTGINGTVSGLNTAFYTTLIGAILGGVVLRILNGVVDANILSYMAHLSELTDVYVLPPMRKLARQLVDSGYYARQAKGAKTT